MITYVVTEESHWMDPSKSYLNSKKGTVSGIYYTRNEAIDRVNWLLSCSLYGPYFGKWINEDTAIINEPGYLKAKFRIFEH